MPWLAMELLKGEELAAYAARRGALPPSEVLQIFEQLCHAVAAAHAGGIVHRDLKPQNVFLAASRRSGADFTVKVLDFGIAKIVSDAKTAVTAAIGTPLWMAPEQAQRGKAVLPATDVWALGLIAFRLLVGKVYWLSGSDPDASPMMTLTEMMMEPLVPASERAAELGYGGEWPPRFDAWFARCVDRNAAARFPDAASALKALRSALREDDASTAKPDERRPALAPAPDTGAATIAAEPLGVGTDTALTDPPWELQGRRRPLVPAPASNAAPTPAVSPVVLPRADESGPSSQPAPPMSDASKASPRRGLIIVGAAAAVLATFVAVVYLIPPGDDSKASNPLAAPTASTAAPAAASATSTASPKNDAIKAPSIPETSTPLVGGTGGTHKVQRCPAGQTPRGFFGLKGPFLYQAGVLCSRFVRWKEGRAVFERVSREGPVGQHYASADEYLLECPVDALPVAITVATADHGGARFAGGFHLECAPLLRDGDSWRIDSTKAFMTEGIAGTLKAVTRERVACERGAAIGLAGNAGAWIDSLGLRCGAPDLGQPATAPAPTASAETPDGGPRIMKADGDGQVIPLGAWKNFSVKIVDAKGNPITDARVAWRTPALGARTYIGKTDRDGMSSATQIYTSAYPGSFEQTAALVDPSWKGGQWSDIPVPTTGVAVTFRYQQR